MGKRRVIWRQEALNIVSEYVKWYRQTMSTIAVRKFVGSLKENTERISKLPGIGIREPQYKMEGFTVRSVLIYKYYRILYGYNEKELVILALWDVRSIRNNKPYLNL